MQGVVGKTRWISWVAFPCSVPSNLRQPLYDPWQTRGPHAVFLEAILKDQHQSHGLECRNMEREDMLTQHPEKCLGLQGTCPWTDMGRKMIDCPDFARDSSVLWYMEWSGIRACWCWTLTRAESDGIKDERVDSRNQTNGGRFLWTYCIGLLHLPLPLFPVNKSINQSISSATTTYQSHPKWLLVLLPFDDVSES